MMTSKAFNIVMFCVLLSGTATAQFRLSGTVTSAADSAIVKECTVFLNNEKRSSVTDGRGRFIFEDVPNGKYTLHFTSVDYKYYKTDVTISNRDEFVRIALQPGEEILAEVTVTDVQSGFGFTRMRGVENMGIYEGKKSEVIIPEQLVANLATNNARQVYSRVAGLNIWENDGAGLQLSIGGRGLDPNRTSNFNTRQNGYDISADALGYPESYFTPPTEAIGKIQIVRGAASLQYGTQFGGLINFVMKKPVADRKLELLARQSIGSYGFYNAFTSASGTLNKVSYYTFFQYKRGDGWRENSHFDNHTAYANVNYSITDNTRIGIDITQMGYLSQQPGGLSDEMFVQDPRQSNRSRNWFKVNWNLLALHLDHKFSSTSEFNARLFGLSANRYSLGFRPNRVATIDDNSERDLIKGEFRNWGVEARYLNRYVVAKIPSVILFGTRYYHGFNHSTQGAGSTGSDADFDYINGDEYITYDYQFPNRNVSLFAENIFYIHEKLSLTPGVRYENIRTTADGYYGTIYKDLAGNIINVTRTEENRENGRHFILAGIGVSYKPTHHIDVYTNIAQNYRSITFSDMRIANPSSVIDPNLGDEKGYSFDLGIRSEQTALFSYDVSVFYLNYNNRIGEVQFYDEYNRVMRRRGNIGQAIIQGLEAYGEIDLLGFIYNQQDVWSGVVFNNIALIHSNYQASEVVGVVGNKVEFVPDVNLKTGVRVGYKSLKASLQYTYLSSQFTDATNAREGGVSAVVGTIPAYSIVDLSLSYQYKKFRIEGTVNNLTDAMYFTRRATGYPGPGILPSDGRSFFLTLQLKI
jgi:Fe(3+) dicitrate transport protein